MSVVPVYFAPDIDTAWSSNPGALASLNAFAPLQLGVYGSVGLTSYISGDITGTDHFSSYIFRQVNGTTRFLTFRQQNIDEYTSALARTNQGTGYNASTTSWSAAAWGNQIIACNYLDATQSSTGTTFTALGGSSPKARYIAANLNFVMLADTDDGVNQYSDQVWWCALQNPGSWTPSIATQAGNIRLLDAPGPIRQLVAYRDTFVAFKDNSIFLGEYVGPSFIFQWRLVSNRVGCIAPKSVVELDGKLYFVHSSGFYEFDGMQLRNIGLPIFQSFMAETGYITRVVGDTSNQLGASFTISPVTNCQSVVDDIEGIAWFSVGYYDTNGGQKYAVMYGYNSRSGRWGRYNAQIGAGAADTRSDPVLVRATFADTQAFKSFPQARFLIVCNGTVGTNNITAAEYPVVTQKPALSSIAITPCSLSTGVFGSPDGSTTLSGVYYRTISGTDDDPGIVVTVNGYTSENKNKTNGTKACSYNSEFDVAQGVLSSKFQTMSATWATGKKVVIAGMAPIYAGQTKR